MREKASGALLKFWKRGRCFRKQYPGRVIFVHAMADVVGGSTPQIREKNSPTIFEISYMPSLPTQRHRLALGVGVNGAQLMNIEAKYKVKQK